MVERLAGETIPRKILRDPEYDTARQALTAQCGRALAAIHTIDPSTVGGLPPADPLRDPLPLLDALGEVRPALELGVRWLAAHRPEAGCTVTVHGDFRMGNLLVGPNGLRGVLDWELAHAGDPAEDIGWLCAPAWRFGGPGEVGGFGPVPDLRAAYESAGGAAVAPDVRPLVAGLRDREVGHHLRAAGVGALERRRRARSSWPRSAAASARASGISSSSSGCNRRRPPEPVSRRPDRPALRPSNSGRAHRGRARVRRSGLMEQGEGAVRFEARVAPQRARGSSSASCGSGRPSRPRMRPAWPGSASPTTLRWPPALRAGDLDTTWKRVAPALAASARDQLLVANPPTCRRPRRRGARAAVGVVATVAGTSRRARPHRRRPSRWPGTDALEDRSRYQAQPTMNSQA